MGETPFQFHERGLRTDPLPGSLGSRTLCLAICAAQATYDGLEETQSDKRNLVGGHVVFSDGPNEVQGTIVEVDEQAEVIYVQGPDGRRHKKSCGCVESVCQFSRAAALETLSLFDTGATRIMWSTGFGPKESVAKGSPHPHIVIEAYLTDKPTLVVACRGSVTGADWRSDFSAFRLPRNCATWESSIHGGFLERAETIPLEPIVEHLRRGGSVLFTGHSLGSAVAEVLCIKTIKYIDKIGDPQLESALHGRVAFIGFASPVVCTEELGNKLRSDHGHGNIFHHFQAENDIVPLLSNVAAVSTTSDIMPAKNSISSVSKHLMRALLTPHAAILKHLGALLSSVLSVTTPKLTKGFGWWYECTEQGSERSLVKCEGDVLHLMDRESVRVSRLDPTLLVEGVAEHLMQCYRNLLQTCLVPAPAPKPCACEYIFPLDCPMLTCSAKYTKGDKSQITLSFESAPGDLWAAPMFVNIVRTMVFVNGRRAQLTEKPPEMLKYYHTRNRPYAREITFRNDTTNDPDIIVTFHSLYSMKDGVPQALTMAPHLIK